MTLEGHLLSIITPRIINKMGRIKAILLILICIVWLFVKSIHPALHIFFNWIFLLIVIYLCKNYGSNWNKHIWVSFLYTMISTLLKDPCDLASGDGESMAVKRLIIYFDLLFVSIIWIILILKNRMKDEKFMFNILYVIFLSLVSWGGILIVQLFELSEFQAHLALVVKSLFGEIMQINYIDMSTLAIIDD